uniref:Uncharacterized protein n=1 Tax=Anguilla anguilla TaxID=7936 RepID=A0A0E9PGL9_ANGAN
MPALKLETDVRRFEDVSARRVLCAQAEGQAVQLEPTAPSHPAGPVCFQPIPDLRGQVPAVRPRASGTHAHLQVHRPVHDHHQPLAGQR